MIHLLVFLLAISSSGGKTINGILKSKPIFYLDRFCFQGESSISYNLNSSAKGNIYLYTDEQLANAQAITHCLEKFKLSSHSYPLRGSNGKITVQRKIKKPQYLNLVYGDPISCGNVRPNEKDYFYKFEMFNPDSDGHLFNHFSYDDSGLLTFFEIIVVLYIIAACTFGHRLWQTISKGGPMYMAIKMLMVAMLCQAAYAGCMLVHLVCYSRDGEGMPLLSYLAIVLDGLSHYQMLVMMVSLAVGLPSGASAIYDSKEERLINNVVVAISIVQIVLIIWKSTMAVSLLRIIICIALAVSIKKTIAKERSALRRDFFEKFTVDCYIWWLCYPALSMFAVLLAEYTRKKFVIFGVTVGQSIAVGLLFRLFLSRSLFWEVSSLSSATLPLRLEKSFGMKKYTS